MKSIAIGLIIIMGTITAANAAQWDKLRVAIEGAYPPFSETLPNGELVGFDVDIANALCAVINTECVLIQQDWDGLIPGLLARKYDAIVASMSITEERKKRVSFTNKYYTSPASFIRPFNSDVSAIIPGRLRGKVVGVQSETVMETFLAANYGDLVTIKGYTTQEEAFLDLAAGRLDLVFAEMLQGTSFLKSEQGKRFVFVGPIFADPQWFGEGIGIAVRKQDNELLQTLNQALETIRTNGTYDEIRRQYFDYDIYGE